MHIQIEHVRAPFHFRATTDNGQVVHMDSSTGAEAAGASPMQLVAMAVGGCSAIDLVDILTKGRHEIEALSITVDTERAPKPPRVFTEIRVHYELRGPLAEDAVRRAVRLSLDKYCSVSKMLDTTATIVASFSINGEEFQTC
jgi:putative redox protein